MPDGKDRSFKLLAIIVALAGVIVGAVALYLTYWRGKETDFPQIPPAGDTGSDPGVGPVEGSPEIWTINKVNPEPARNIWIYFPQPLSLNLVQGQIRIILDGSLPSNRVGFSLWAWKNNGEQFRIKKFRRTFCYGEGWYPFEASIGLNDISAIYFTIDWECGPFGGTDYRFTEVQGQAILII